MDIGSWSMTYWRYPYGWTRNLKKSGMAMGAGKVKQEEGVAVYTKVTRKPCCTLTGVGRGQTTDYMGIKTGFQAMSVDGVGGRSE